MKQVVQNYRTGELTVVKVPSPCLRPGGALVSVAASLVSAGTERTMVSLAQASLLDKARQRPDLVRQVINKARQEGILTAYGKVQTRLDNLSPLGYSCAGTVIAVGERVADLRPGDPVACAGAGYASHAEVVFVPSNLVARIPGTTGRSNHGKKVPFEHAAFATLGAIALQGVRQVQPTLGETIAVIGLGLVGQLTVQLLKANGCRVLGMDPNAERGRMAEESGCDATAVDNAQFSILSSQWTDGRGADGVIITAATKSSEPVELAAELCRDRGRVVVVGLVGLNVPRKPFYEKELDLRFSRSYGPGRYDPQYEEHGHDYPIGHVRWTENRNMHAFLDLLAAGKLDVESLITHRFPIEDATKAYDLITGERAAEALGIILTYPNYESKSTDTSSDVVYLESGTPKTQTHRSAIHGSTVRLGLIGAGNFARGTLLPALKGVRGARLHAVCSASGLSARHVAEKHGAGYCTADAEQIIHDPDVDAVLIATRHGSHAALTIEALTSGKPVLVEKPLAVNDAQLKAIVQAYCEMSNPNGQTPNSALLMVGYNRRFAPLAVAMREFLAQARPLIIHYRVNAGYIAPDSWLHDPVEGGGRIVGEVCHFVDFLQFLAAAEPVQVDATAAGLGRSDIVPEGNVVVQIGFSDGSVGSILYAACGDKAFPKERVEAFGGGRVAVLDDFRTLELVQHGRRRVRRSRFIQDKGHSAELAAFVHAVRAREAPPTPLGSLVQTTLTTFRIRDALHTRQAQAVAWRDDPSQAAPPRSAAYLGVGATGDER